MFHNTLIIGGGASGLVAANRLKDFNIDVALIEKNNRIGKKILITGNGRCNISNKNLTLDRFHSENCGFFNNILTKYNFSEIKTFLDSLGIPLIELEDSKMYPLSLQASSVVDIFRLSLEEKEIPLYNDISIINITINKNIFKVKSKDGTIFSCKNLILATGGKSYEKTGSNGSGYTFAKKFGHSLTNLYPSILQLKLNYPHLKALKGIKFHGTVDILVDNKFIRSDSGEVLFTDYGISGPPIFQLSRIASIATQKNKKCILNVDLLPNHSREDLVNMFETRAFIFNNRSIHDFFIGILNKKLIPIFLKHCGIVDIHAPVYILDYSLKNVILRTLKCWEFEVIDTNGFNNAQVTAGGINTKEVSDITLESKIVKNLYFCGEILDVDGDCGGFNLSWAFSSALATSDAIIEKLK